MDAPLSDHATAAVRRAVATWVIALGWVIGCGTGESASPAPDTAAPPVARSDQSRSDQPLPGRHSPEPRDASPIASREPSTAGDSAWPADDAPADLEGRPPTDAPGGDGSVATESDPTPEAQPRPKRRREGSLADLLTQTADSAPRFLPDIPRMSIDDRRAAAEGIRRVDGKHLTLYTDLPPEPSVDELPEVFDLAVPQWCDYFGLDPAEHADWHCTAFVMEDRERFRRAGLLPDSLPPFPHGYSRNFEFWVDEQPSEYYRRHLVLHEGTHSFMNTLLGACGPPWYMEGIAELLATHRWAAGSSVDGSDRSDVVGDVGQEEHRPSRASTDGRLTLNVVPPSAEAVSHWGRVRIIKDAFRENRAVPLHRVIDYPPAAHRETEPYAWCWAAATLLDRHPEYHALFRDLAKHVTDPAFNDRFRRAVGPRWPELCAQWQTFIAGMEYGYDVERNAIDFTPGRPIPRDGATVSVAADRGWQNTGWRLEAGRTYRLTARGRYQVDDDPQPWPCEPGGVTMRYYAGRPLGMLLGAVQPPPGENPETDPPAVTVTPLLRPLEIGLSTRWTPRHDGTLMLKVNDSAAELSDNAGSLSVRIVPD